MSRATDITNSLDLLLKQFGQNLAAKFEPGEDSSVDDAIQILRDGKETGLGVHIGRSSLGVGWFVEAEDTFYGLYDGNDPAQVIKTVTTFIRGGWRL